ncbi:MAG: tyrosine-type recombinase/integrase [Deltaproteobacteria bacterium]|nr:tyrosine-type recombinase/integrase [Deltaproteobacteria bacterium]
MDKSPPNSCRQLRNRHRPLAQPGAPAVEDLLKAIGRYLKRMQSENAGNRTRENYQSVFLKFYLYVKDKKLSLNEMFTENTISGFKRAHGLLSALAVNKLSEYLFDRKKISAPIPCAHQPDPLPEIYEAYLFFHQISRQSSYRRAKQIQRVLRAFHQHLEKNQINLYALRIEQVDAFLGEFNAPFSPTTRRLYRSTLRGFLSYLYQQRGLLQRDLAALVVGPVLFAQKKPPTFLRPKEIKQLFESLGLSSAKEIRNYAMVHLAYFMGLRPKEISLITLDDISFGKAELTLNDRKNNQPIILPVAEPALKAITAYIVGARPKGKNRRLFLTLNPPYVPLCAAAVGRYITRCMRNAGLSASAYWLRHTYAQNLLEAGMSIFEIKEMMGHDTIESTRKYLYIHIKLMREVLFDETV